MTSRLLQQRGRQDHHDAVLGHTFASYRGDRVIALDGNPDAGSLAYRVRREPPTRCSPCSRIERSPAQSLTAAPATRPADDGQPQRVSKLSELTERHPRRGRLNLGVRCLRDHDHGPGSQSCQPGGGRADQRGSQPTTAVCPDHDERGAFVRSAAVKHRGSVAQLYSNLRPLPGRQ